MAFGRFWPRSDSKLVYHRPPDVSYTIEPQRAQFIPYWYCDTAYVLPDTERTETTTLACCPGSRVFGHNAEVLVYGADAKPGRIYFQDYTLNWADLQDPYWTNQWCGSTSSSGIVTTGWTDTYTEDTLTPTTDQLSKGHYITDLTTTKIAQVSDTIGNARINESPNLDIQVEDIRRSESLTHFSGPLRDAVIYEQRYGMSSGPKRIPRKAMRISPNLVYGTLVLNDYLRPSDADDVASRNVTLELQRSFIERPPEENIYA